MSTFGERYGRFRGALKDLPSDLSRNHDRPMKTPPKKLPKKLAPKAKPERVQAPAAIVRVPLIQMLDKAMLHTRMASDQFAERMDVLRDEKAILQDDLSAVTGFEAIGKAAEAPVKLFKDFARALLVAREAEIVVEATGQKPRLDVEVGTRVLTFEDNRKITPAWKDQAIRHAQILHAVAAAFVGGNREQIETLLAPFHGPFDLKVWEEAIRRITPKSGSLTPKIVEG